MTPSSEEARQGFQYPAMKPRIPKTRSAGEFVGALPPEELRNFIILIDTESAQGASCDQPRVLLPGTDSTTIYGVSTMDGTVEVMHHQTDKKFGSHIATWEDGQPGQVSENDSTCVSCHSSNVRPNWDTYDNWAYAVPFNRDRIYEGSEEAKYFARFWGEIAPNDPALKHLVPPAGIKRKLASKEGEKPVKYEVTFDWNGSEPEKEVSAGADKMKRGGRYLLMQHPEKGRSDEGQGVALFDNLSKLNADRVAAEIMANDKLPLFKDALIGLLNRCRPKKADPAPLDFLGEKARNYLKMANALGDFAAYHKKLTDGQKKFMEEKLQRIKNGLESLVKCNAEAEGKKLSQEEVDRRVKAELYRRDPTGFSMFDGQLVDREDYRAGEQIAALSYLMEPFGVPARSWSLSVAENRRSKTFADQFSLYSSAIRRELEKKYRDDFRKSCEDLAAAAETTLGTARLPETSSEGDTDRATHREED